MRQKEIDLMDDGFDKRYSQLKLNYEKELQAAREFAEKQLKAQQEIEKQQYIKSHGTEIGFTPVTASVSGLSSNIQNQIKQMYDSAESAMSDGNKKVAEDIDDFLGEQSARLASELDKQLYDIEQYYRDKIKIAGTNEELIRKLTEDKGKEIANAVLESRLKMLEFEESIESQRHEISNKDLVFEAEKERRLLEITKKYAKNRLDALKKAKDSGVGNLEKDIKALELFIEKLDSDGKEISHKLIGEAADGASDILGAFEGLSDELDGVISKTKTFAGAISQLSSGNYIGAAVSVVSSVVASIASENQKAIAESKRIEGGYWDSVNYKIQKQIDLMKELKDLSSTDVNILIDKEIDELVDRITTFDFNKTKAEHAAFIQRLSETYEKSDDDFTKNLAKQMMYSSELRSSGFGKGSHFRMYDMLKGLSADQLISLKENRDIWSLLPKEIQDYINQLSEAVDKQKELNDYVNETLTGTTKDNIKSTIIDALSGAKDGVDDFAGYFEDQMKKSMLGALERDYLDPQIEAYYKLFSELSQDGLTDDEIERLREFYQNIVSGAKEEFENMQKIAGLDFSQDSDSGNDNTLKGAYAKASQESIDLLAGQTGAVCVDVGTIRAALEARSEHTQGIINEMLLMRDIHIRGWESVRAIKELTVRVADNSDQIRDLSAAVSANTKRTADVLDTASNGNSLRVKIQGV